MTFGTRWLTSVFVAFLLFPVVLVIRSGDGSEIVASLMMAFFVTFISPYSLWLIPILAGTVFALGWQGYAQWRSQP